MKILEKRLLARKYSNFIKLQSLEQASGWGQQVPGSGMQVCVFEHHL